MPSTNGRPGNANSNGPISEDTPLLGHHSQPSTIGRIRRYMTENVDSTWGDLILLLCYLITGLLDSCAVKIWGAFVSMQTGNTVYFGLGVTDPGGSSRWIKSILSIGCFCFGSFCFSRFHRFFGPKRRWVLVVSFIVQTAFVVAAAVISTVIDDGEKDLHWQVLAPLAFVAFQGSGQAVVSRALKFNSLTSVVLTSIYCDLFADPQLFAMPTQNPERNRRVAAPLCLLVGAIFGGLWANSQYGIGGALWTAVVLKLFVVFAWLLWRKDPASE